MRGSCGGFPKGGRVDANWEAMQRMDLTDDSDSLVEVEEEDVEDESEYRYGGYHRVFIGELFNKKYRVVRKIGLGHF